MAKRRWRDEKTKRIRVGPLNQSRKSFDCLDGHGLSSEQRGGTGGLWSMVGTKSS